MRLSDYMTLNDLSDEDVARKIKRSRPTVSRIRRAVVRPDWDTIEELRRFTKGQVTAVDYPPPAKPSPSPKRERASA